MEPILCYVRPSTEGVTIAQKLKADGAKARALVGLAFYLPESQRERIVREAAAMVHAIYDFEDQAEVLASLVPHLAELDGVQEALTTAQQILDEEFQAKALSGLSLQLMESGCLKEALVAAGQILDKEHRAKVLAQLSSHLVKLPIPTLYPLWRETLSYLAARTRQDLLSDLHALTPVIFALGGTEATKETFHAIQDVGRWWP